MFAQLFGNRVRASAAPLLALALCLFACDLGDAAQRGYEGEDFDPQDAFLELGQGLDEHRQVVDGDVLELYLGGQGLVMFAFTLRTGGFEVPENPLNYTDELAPVVDVGVEIPGFGEDNGYLRYVESFPLALHTVQGDAGERLYEAVYVPVILPDDLDPEAIFGTEASVLVRLRPALGPSISVRREMIVGDALLFEE